MLSSLEYADVGLGLWCKWTGGYVHRRGDDETEGFRCEM